MNYQDIIIEKEKDTGVAWLKLNRPNALNALSKRLLRELVLGFDEIEHDPSVRVVILKGNGRSFCAGGDLMEYPRTGGDLSDDPGFTGLWEKMEHLSKPIIAAVHGWAVTGGFLLSYCSDIVIAAESARFADTHARYGLLPTAGESQRLPRRIGLMHAKFVMFTSDPIDGHTAEKMGLVIKVVPDAELDSTALELARKIAQNSPKSLKALKANLNSGMEVDFAGGMRIELMNNRYGRANTEPDEDRDNRLNKFRKK